MARITYKLYPAFFESGHDVDDGILTTGTSTKAVLTDYDSGDRMIFEGTGLSYGHGTITGGTVHKLTIVDEDGEKFLSIQDFKIDMRFLTGDTVLEQVQAFAKTIVESDLRVIGTKRGDDITALNGDDLILAGVGDDRLDGSYGKDVLFGGVGEDVFVFSKGRGNDVIRDFDAKGGEGFQDHIGADFGTVESIVRSGKDTLIDFGDGDILTLMNIKPNQIDQTDFI